MSSIEIGKPISHAENNISKLLYNEKPHMKYMRRNITSIKLLPN